MTKRVTLITGASSGIGAELARIFASNGADTVLVARREDRLQQLASEIAAAGYSRPKSWLAIFARRMFAKR
jgi:short-subunit dehydrogenase